MLYHQTADALLTRRALIMSHDFSATVRTRRRTDGSRLSVGWTSARQNQEFEPSDSDHVLRPGSVASMGKYGTWNLTRGFALVTCISVGNLDHLLSRGAEALALDLWPLSLRRPAAPSDGLTSSPSYSWSDVDIR